jgi:PAS domain S-box-containing protein
MSVQPASESSSGRSPPSPGSRSGTERDRLFEHSLDLLCVAGLDGYFRQVSPSWTHVLGWTEVELLSRPIADFMHPDDREMTLQARAALAKGTPVRDLENRYLCKDGSYRWLSWQSTIEPGGDTVFAVARDITERRHSDQERLLISRLESSGLLAGGLAHDFNNLLTGLLLNLEMLGLSGPLNAAQLNQLCSAKDSLHTARALTRQLITLAQPDGLPVNRRDLDIRPLIERALSHAVAGSSIRAETRFAPDLWTVTGDEDRLEQVIRSLAFNAREAMPDGGLLVMQAENVPGPVPVIEPASLADTSISDAPRHIVLRLIDEGAGMTPEVLQRIFDPYFSTKQRNAQKGMGLSLPICRAVLRRHGGTIEIESSPGRGTTVTCRLPAT